MVGQTDRLRAQTPDHWKGRKLDLGAVLHRPEVRADVALHCVQNQDHDLEGRIDHALIRLAAPALERGEPVAAALPIRNVHRAAGAMLSGEIAKRYGRAGLPDDTIRFQFTGSAGQSFGAFAAAGLTLTLEGEANDYVGKGLSGGRLVIYPSRRSTFVPEETIVVGNTVLYGATGGEAYFQGLAGERFAVRNSGARAVVEGVGDHGCEYMTGGVVVVLGRTGRNFGAGMSGGVAYVLDEAGDFERGCNLGLVELEPVADRDDQETLRGLVERHAHLTGSGRGRWVLEHWRELLPRFVKVIPVEYKKVLLLRTRREQDAKHTARQEMAAHG